MKIRYKLFVVFVAAAISTALIGYFVCISAEKALEHSIGHKFEIIAKSVLNNIDRTLYYGFETFRDLARSAEVVNAASESNLRFENLEDVQGYINKKDKEWTSAPRGTITPFMQELMDNRLSKKLHDKIEYYRRYYGFRVYVEVFLTNKYGANIAQTGKTSDYRQDDEQWWQIARRKGLSVEDVHYDRSAGAHSIDMGIRINGEAGNFAGVMKVVLNIQKVINLLGEIEKESGEHNKTLGYRLCTKDGKTIYATTEYRALGELPDYLQLHLFEREPDGAYFVGEHGGVVGGGKLLAHAHSKGYRDYEGLGWELIIEQSLDEIFAPVYRLRKVILLSVLFATALVMVIGALICRSISKPIVELSGTVSKIGRETLDIPVEVRSRDEVGQLAKSFREMIENLKKTTTSISCLKGEIVERKRIERELRASEERYKSILTSIEEGYYEVDLNGNFTFFNDALCRIYGYARDELMGMNNREYMSPNASKRTYEVFNKVYRTGIPATMYDFEFIQKAGNKIDVQISISLINDSEDRPVGFRGIVRDVSERKRIEEERKHFETQILLSEKMASVGQLAAGVAHEINNPTGFVSSNLRTLSDYNKDICRLVSEYRKVIADLQPSNVQEKLPASISERIAQIKAFEKEVDVDFILHDLVALVKQSKEGTERIKKIVKDLKDFAHPGNDKLQRADINQCIECTLNVVWNEIKYKAEVKKEYGNVPLIECYPQQLNQVFMNILVNAAQAIERQGEINISTRRDDGYVEIEMSDTGPGIPKENLSRIFDPFFTTKEVGKGTGLGLNVAYNIIEKHKGSIHAQSEMGKGTTFFIRIPVRGMGEDLELGVAGASV